MKQLIAELNRRNVSRVAITYLAAAWLLVEVADTTFPRFGFEDSAVRNVIVLLAIGFIPALVLSWFFELTPEGLTRDLPGEAPKSDAPRTSRMADRLIVIMLLGAVALLAIDKFVLEPTRVAVQIEEATEAARTEAVLRAYGDKSIAVLAFSDMSPTRDQEYLSDGIAEELLNLLSTIKELRVISRSSAFSFKGSDATVPEIAEKLGVSYILEGSVRKSGNNIRITAQLIDARADAHVWSDNYDRTLDDVFAIQDEISNSIVEKLRVTLLAGAPRSQRIDPEAYEKYLQAQFILHTENKSQFRKAQALLNEVLEVAPDYIPALNALARIYYRIPKTEGLSREQNEAEIRALAARVVAIDPDGISSLIWQGWFAALDKDMQTAAKFYEKAIQIDPNNTDLARVLVIFLTDIGRPDDAVALSRYLLLRDPACAVCVGNYAYALRSAGNPGEAAVAMESMLDWHTAQPGYYWSLGVGWLIANQPQKALDAFEKEEGYAGNREMGSIMALHDLGRTEEFESRFADFRNNGTDSESVARVYAWIGDNDSAFKWLEKLIETEGPSRLREVDTDLYDKIKTDPRWREMRSEYGFEDKALEPIDFTFTLPLGAEMETGP